MTTPPRSANAKQKTPSRQASPLDWDDFDASGEGAFTCSFPHPNALAERAKKGRRKRPQIAIQQDNESGLTYVDENYNPVQRNPFEGVVLPDVHYHVEPADYWWGAQAYRKFTGKSRNLMPVRTVRLA